MTIVNVEDEGAIRWITFDRPGKMNALRDEDLLAVTASLNSLPDTIEAVVFQGAHGNFSAGMYVGEFSGYDLPKSMAHIRIGANFLKTIRALPVPTIAAIEGYCVGLAFDVSLVCDFRIVSDQSSFSMPEIKLGMPCVMDISLLQQHIGITRAKEMLLTGSFYPAKVMDEWGFINRVVPAGTVHEAAESFAQEHLVDRSPYAMASQKRLFETWLHHTHSDGVEISLMEYGMNFADPDTQGWISKYRAAMADKKN